MLAIFTEGNIDDSNSTITLFSGMTHLMNSIVRKSKTIEKAANRRKNKILQKGSSGWYNYILDLYCLSC